MNSAPTVRVNISLPKPLLTRLKNSLPNRGLSQFLTQAAKEKLDQRETKQALDQLVQSPKSFDQVKDAIAFVNQNRATDDKRSRRLGL